MKFLIAILLLIQLPFFSNAQDYSTYQKKWMVQGGDTLPYRVLMPEKFDSTKKYPVIFFLHGAGERGNDNQKQLTHGAKLFLQDSIRKSLPAIVIFPQCSREDYWSNVLRTHGDGDQRTFTFLEDGPQTRAMEMLQELVTYVIQNYPVQKTQMYVGGLSMGGMGTYELVRRMPNTFAAAFAICGGADPATAKQMKDVSWWIFHGLKDDVVPPVHSENMVKALMAQRARVRYKFFPNANHNSWDSAFAEPELLPWLFKQHR